MPHVSSHQSINHRGDSSMPGEWNNVSVVLAGTKIPGIEKSWWQWWKSYKGSKIWTPSHRFWCIHIDAYCCCLIPNLPLERLKYGITLRKDQSATWWQIDHTAFLIQWRGSDSCSSELEPNLAMNLLFLPSVPLPAPTVQEWIEGWSIDMVSQTKGSILWQKRRNNEYNQRPLWSYVTHLY